MRSGVILLQGSAWILLSLSVSFSEPARAQTETIQIDRGFSKILRLPHPAHLVAVGDPTVADATIGTDNTLVLTAKKIGATNVIALDQVGKEIYMATVGVGDERSKIRIRYPSGDKNKEPGAGVVQTFLCDLGCNLEKEERPPAAAAQ
jgi:hypothetical protein